MINKLTDMIRKHVMDDLRPYVCVFPNCSKANETYASRGAFLREMLRVHRDDKPQELVQSRACVFCAEVLPCWDEDHIHHFTRHMEEVAFMVVTDPYEDWDLYSDATTISQSTQMEEDTT